MKNDDSSDAVNKLFEWLHAIATHPIHASVSVAVVIFVATAIGAGVLVTISEQSPEVWNNQAALGNVSPPKVLGTSSFGYSAPAASMSIGWMDFSTKAKKWNIRIDYTTQFITDGSIKVNKNMFADHISQSGSTFTGYNLLPKTRYLFVFYSASKGKGTVLSQLDFITPPAPQPYGY